MDLFIKQNLLLMVRALYFCQEERWAELGKKFDITPAQQHILYLLSTNKEALTPTRISELGCWHNSTVTRLLKPMKERALIRIETDHKQPRYKVVSLTPEGSQLLNDIVEEVRVMEDFPFDMAGFQKEEVRFFLECGQRILDIHKGNEFKEMVIQAHMEGVNYDIG